MEIFKLKTPSIDQHFWINRWEL